jgi:hypothetical protein
MKVIKLVLLLFLFPQCYLLAQYPSPAGPFNYIPNDPEINNNDIDYRYLGKISPFNHILKGTIFDLGSLYVNYNTIGQYDDCLQIEGYFDINTATDNNKPLVAFEYDTKRLLEIRYSDSTAIIRRYNHEKMINNKPSFYDYTLFDPLFISRIPNTGNSNWLIQVYFTSNFMLILTSENVDYDTNGYKYYMSPIYFGLDFKNMLAKDGDNQFIDNGSYMYKYLKKDSNAKIIIGDIRGASPYAPYIDYLSVFSMSYASYPYDKSKRDSKDKRKNLWWHIQGNLSSPVDEPSK